MTRINLKSSQSKLLFQKYPGLRGDIRVLRDFCTAHGSIVNLRTTVGEDDERMSLYQFRDTGFEVVTTNGNPITENEEGFAEFVARTFA